MMAKRNLWMVRRVVLALVLAIALPQAMTTVAHADADASFAEARRLAQAGERDEATAGVLVEDVEGFAVQVGIEFGVRDLVLELQRRLRRMVLGRPPLVAHLQLAGRVRAWHPRAGRGGVPVPGPGLRWGVRPSVGDLHGLPQGR